jgi:hypothetical protein
MVLSRSLFAIPVLLLAPAGAHGIAARSAANPAPPAKANECKKAALLARKAKLAELAGEYALALGAAQNFTDPNERKDWLDQAKQNLKDGIGEAHDQFAARLELCDALGGGAYDPTVAPQNFVASVTNPYFPLTPGKVYNFVKTNAAGTENITVEVTNDTKVILGVTCTVVHDSVKLNNVLIEDTLDYYAQDVAGNVWYFGEDTIEYEDGVAASLEGSWIAGKGGAKPGIIMKASPVVGETYRQELLLGDAEDAATVESLTATATVPLNTYTNCIQTLEYTPLEPGTFEKKYYASGIGVVLEVDVETGDRLELVSTSFK